MEGAAAEGIIDERAMVADLVRVASDISSDGGVHSSDRASMCDVLSQTPRMPPDHPLFKHGRLSSEALQSPKCVWKSDKPPRDDHDCPPWLTASEFEDQDDAGAAKLRQLVCMLHASRRTVLYTGAGISASVVGQAARSGSNTVGWEKVDLMSAKPTPSHCVLAEMGKMGLIHSWLQQNHDGLPQKAGYPQELINEVHGSWFDPSNPVVKYTGTLLDRAYDWMQRDIETADLVIVLGTSLGGLTADDIVKSVAARSCHGSSLGAVCINLQQTPLDGLMSLRLFGKSDNVLQRLMKQLGMGKLPARLPRWPTAAALVPYDAAGRLIEEGGRRMWLDFSDRQRVIITPGHNIQGAQQPPFMHIGASKPHKHKGLVREPCEGRGFVMRREQFHWLLSIEGVQMKIGLWWLDVAMRGAVEVLPLVNYNPRFEGDPPVAGRRFR